MNKNCSIPTWLSVHIVFGTLLGLLSTFLLLFGLQGYYNPWFIGVSHFLFGIAFIVSMVMIYRRSSGRTLSLTLQFTFPEKVLVVANLGVIILTIVQGLVPPFDRDALIHHLALPLLYLQSHRIYDISFAEQAFNPMLGDLLFSLPLVLAQKFSWADCLSRIVHYMFGLGTAHLLYSFLSLLYGRKEGLLAALLFLSLPVVLQSGSQTYVDLVITYYCFLSWVCLFVWFGHASVKANTLWVLGASGTMMGWAMASKYNGFLMVPFTVLILLFGLLRLQWNAKRIGICLFIFLFSALVVDSSWLLKNYLWSGNPIYPYLRSIWGWKGIPAESLGEIPALFHRSQIYRESFFEILMLPLRIFFTGKEGEPRLFDGRLSPILLVFLPFLFFAKEKKTRLIIASCAFLVFFYFIYVAFFRILRMRYLLPIVPLLVLLTIIGWRNVRASWQPFARAALILAIVVHLTWGVLRMWDLQAVPYLLGKWTREEYLTKQLPEYRVQVWANDFLTHSDKILFVLLGDRGYYCRIPYVYDFHDPGRSWRRWLKGSSQADDIGRLMRQEGITHIMAPSSILWGAVDDVFWLKEEPEKLLHDKEILREFFRIHTKVIFQSGDIQLLALN